MNAFAHHYAQFNPPQAHAPDDCPMVHAGLSYVMPSSVRPRSYAFTPPSGEQWENSEYDVRNVAIRDARAQPLRPALEREGFALWDAATQVKDFCDADVVKRRYYPEALGLALAATGAAKAYVFDHLVRRREPREVALSFGRKSPAGQAGANGRIHNDYTQASGARRLPMVVTDPVELAKVRRYSIINIWRSIKGPVLDTPLAVCDTRTVVLDDLVECDVMYPRRVGEIYLAKYSSAHRWSYFSEMDRHEALVFKQYDSEPSRASRFTLHAAFDHPLAPADAQARESIELRCLVTY